MRQEKRHKSSDLRQTYSKNNNNNNHENFIWHKKNFCHAEQQGNLEEIFQKRFLPFAN